MREFNEIDVVELLPRVSCPTLVLHSSRDVRVPFDEGRLIAGRIPEARFVPLESENHLLLESEPMRHRWADEVRAFLPTMAAATNPAFSALRRERDLLELIARAR